MGIGFRPIICHAGLLDASVQTATSSLPAMGEYRGRWAGTMIIIPHIGNPGPGMDNRISISG